MKIFASRVTVLPWAVAIFLWGMGGTFAAHLTEHPFFRGKEGSAISVQILGNSRIALAESSFERADAYFHKGMGHYREKAFTNDFFQVIKAKISPVGHAHLHGDAVKDVMAWIRMATALDPHNVEYFLTASYLIGNEIGRPDAALEILREAQLSNPLSYRVYLGMGRFYTKGGDKDRAGRAYTLALKLWPGAADPNDEEVRADIREILARLEVLHELGGDIAGAISLMKGIVNMFPNQSALFRNRIVALERGELSIDSAEKRWDALRAVEYHHFCEEEEDAQGDHSGDHAHSRNDPGDEN